MDPAVVSRIAAGEIIVAPANALKEMLENSIDAGSSMIQVLVKDGGLKLLQVTDNGSGILKEDLPILCQRFTTSKLTTFEDLTSIATYGFRGEALASISHIAQVSVVTKTKLEANAWKAHYSHGEIASTKPNDSGEPKPVAGKDGTQISVENLFYNFPTRLSTLRSPNEEYLRVLDVVNKYSIHTEGVGFSVKKVGESHNILTIRESLSLVARIGSVFGSSVADNLISISVPKDAAVPGLESAHGQVSNLNFVTNKKKSSMVFFINNRLVDCDPLKKSLLNVYNAYLPKGCKPFVYLSLAIQPDHLDVNVHPTKKEVRFLHEDEIINYICQVLQEKFNSLDDTRTFKSQVFEAKRPLADPQSKKRKVSLNTSDLKSFSFGAPKVHESKLSRVDVNQTKITSYLERDVTEGQSSNEFTTIINEKSQVNLTSILDLRKEIELNVSKHLTSIFSNFVFVGIVQYSARTLAIQHDISLFLVDYGSLFYELFYQICLSDFSNFGKINLQIPLSIKETIEFVSAETNLQVPNLEAVLARFVEMKNMYQEYFNIIIDSNDPQDPQLVGVPLLVNRYVPSMNKLPLFLFRLATKIEYTDEGKCLAGIIREVALFNVPEALPEYDEISNDETDDHLVSYEKSIELLLKTVKRRFLGTKSFASSVIEVANLPNLYKCFERC